MGVVPGGARAAGPVGACACRGAAHVRLRAGPRMRGPEEGPHATLPAMPHAAWPPHRVREHTSG